MSSIKVLLTGASGFIGSHLLDVLARAGFEARGCVRASVPQPAASPVIPLVFGCALDQVERWGPGALASIDIVIHTAALVHVTASDAREVLDHYRALNTAATLELARTAAQAGVRRFIFLSSIKVNGESTPAGQPFTAADPCAPTDPYALSKWEAEQGLRRLSRDTGMEVVIIRPPLVYGPGVKANFRSLLKWIKRGAVFPLGSVDNRRSLVGLDNLVDLIITCIDHPGAANQTFLVSDNEDLSTPGLVEHLSRAMGRSPRLMPCPLSLLRLGARLAGREDSLSRLCDSLQLDMSHTMDTLGWRPPVSVEDGIQKTVDDFMARRLGGEGIAPTGVEARPEERASRRGEMPSGCAAPTGAAPIGAAPTGVASKGCSGGKSGDA